MLLGVEGWIVVIAGAVMAVIALAVGLITASVRRPTTEEGKEYILDQMKRHERMAFRVENSN